MAGNWKMYKTRAQTEAFVTELTPLLTALPTANRPQLLLCAAFTLLDTLSTALTAQNLPVKAAAQTMESRSEGAYTGEISPLMLADLGIEAVILGHSERREYYNETDATVNAKTLAALAHNLTPIVCVGETLAQREANQTDALIESQLKAALQNVAPRDFSRLVIAYEPVWAIGTGKVCEAPEAGRVCSLIRQTLIELAGEANAQTIRILYGGSMKPDNAASLLAQADIDGGLVGGASLQAASFAQLAEIACAAQQSPALV